MPLPSSLRDHFSNGRVNLSETTALLNPYARWMQSPNIPRISKAPIMLDEFETIIESDPAIDDWIFKLKSESSKQELPVPCFFPDSYKTPVYYTNIYKCPERFIYALLSAHDSCFPLYSDACKRNAVSKLITNVLSNFYNIYNVSVFRLYKKTKPQIYNSLSKSPSIPELHVISEFLKVNIIIVRKFNYEWACIYDSDRKTYCLWEDERNVGSIRHITDGGNINIENMLINKLDIDGERSRMIKINSDVDKREILKSLKSYNTSELSEYAKRNNILTRNEDGIALKKEELFKRVLETILL